MIAKTGVANTCIIAVAYKDQIKRGILNQVIPGARILCTVTIKFMPVRMEENPSIKTPNIIGITDVSVPDEYGV